MTGVYVRLDEEQKTPQQIVQRERTYDAADKLRELGYDCEVVEFFTGSSKTADAAGIRIKQTP